MSSVEYYCPVCQANVATHKGWEHHIRERVHQRKADGTRVPPVDVAPQPAISTATATVCDLCQIIISNRFWNEHLNSRNHKLHEQRSRYMTAVELSETDKNGVVVEGSFDFEVIDAPLAKVGKELTATIRDSQHSFRFVLLEAKLASARERNSGVSS
jgi:helicase MOV-10